ncbi:MAG: putative transport system permease protein [Actinomycetota bacterium]|jgi:putative ABC transport system permease protein|nr:putative transport system permease protein [Actinomycetota bacterium]
MWLITTRDLQWRLRRFLIAGTGAALVFAMTLVLAGLAASFQAEAGRVIDAVGADTWVVPQGVEGPFTTLSLMPSAVGSRVAALPGVRAADPLLVLHQTVDRHAQAIDVNVIGYGAGGMGTPHGVRGRLPRTATEIVVDDSLHLGRGAQFRMGTTQFRIVGVTHGMSVTGGQPVVYLPLASAQRALTGGQPVVSAIVTRGVPRVVPAGYSARSAGQTRTDLLRPLASAIASIQLTELLLWVVAALVVGSVVYLSALERAGDFAVFKATGWSSRALGAGLAMQAVLLSTGASLLGVVVAHALVPAFPMTFSIPLHSALLLPVVGVVVGLLACLSGLRRAVGVDPALAFGGR